MAIIDPDRDAIVIRIIYDGPPLSGKTTSVQTLGRLLGRTTSIFSPEEIEGKTLFFDWMEYVGGLFKGYSISVQIVSVPGQLFLEARRHFLLHTADAVVFVLDASDDPAIPLTYFQNLQTIITQNHDLPVKVIVQANKQDKPNALTAQQLKPYFQDYPQVKIVESSALLSKGVRESFVLGVRLAVERAEILMTKGQLKQGKPEISSAEELLVALQNAVQLTSENFPTPTADLEQVVEPSEEINFNLLLKTADSPTALDPPTLLELPTIISYPEPEQLINKPISSSVPSIPEESHSPSTHSSHIPHTVSPPATEEIPIFPHLDVPLHFLWPPFQTRELLPIFSTLPPPELQEHYWLTYNNHWTCFSKNAWQYQELEEGYHHFQTHLKWHLHCGPLLPRQRALVLATQSPGSQHCRLWQIVPYSATTLMEQFHALWQLPSLDKISLELFKNLIYYVDVQYPMQRYFPTIQVNLQEIMLAPEGGLYYLGPIDFTPSSLEIIDLTTALITLYQPLIKQNLLQNQIDATQIIQELQKIDGFEQQYLIEILTTLLGRISN